MYTTAEKFSSLIAKIQPPPHEMASLEACRKHLIAFLTPRVETARFLLMGSHSRGTAIAGSDMDVLQVIRKRELAWGGGLVSSSTILDRVRQHLASYGRTDVRRDHVALVVSYTSGVKIDLVPGFYYGPGPSNFPVYQIPNGQGGWLNSSPESHNAYIKEADQRSMGKLKRTVQLVKYWRKCRVSNVPLNSFHLEFVLASSDVCVGLKSYSQCLVDALGELAKREARAFRDPLGVSGLISASGTLAQRSSASDSLSNSLDHARRARSAELAGINTESVRQWQLVFNGGFA